MAKIDLKECTIYFMDGLSGTAVATDGITANAANCNVANVDLNTAFTGTIPIGARFSVPDANAVFYTVTARTPANANENSDTTNIEFTPDMVANVNANAELTFAPQKLTIKVGDGTLKWDRNKKFDYMLDRGVLDTVREGDQVPLDVDFGFSYEQVTADTDEPPTPEDAICKSGMANEWVSSATGDPCAPYAINIVLEHLMPCGDVTDERITLPYFRCEKLSHDPKAATITASGKCNVTDALKERVDLS